MRLSLTVIFLFITLGVFAQIEKQIPQKPNPPRLVNDFTGTLTPVQVQALEQKLVAYDDSTSSQIAIVIVPTLGDYDIAEYALSLYRSWGIGGASRSNGILLLVAKDDRKMRIEVGYGLEGAIPDITAKSIIDNSLTPQFREENYYRGLDLATNDIIRAAAGEYKAPANYNKRKDSGRPGFGSIIFLLVLFLLLGGLGGRGRGNKGGGMMNAAGWIIGSMLGSSGRGGGWSGGGGGGWSGGGGGGFGGFGGGSSGGGGASGSW